MAKKKFSNAFGLDLDQSQLDFVDIRLDTDLPLFIDPFTLGERTDHWSELCANQIDSFFQQLLEAVRKGDRTHALRLLSNLHEPNEIHLGLSKKASKGRGIGHHQASQIIDAMKRSRAVQTGIISDLSEAELMIEGVGKDKVSDITANILRKELIRYTQEQCALHGIELDRQVASGPLWDSEKGKWRNDHVYLPVSKGQKIILVPKFFVTWSTRSTSAWITRQFLVIGNDFSEPEYG